MESLAIAQSEIVKMTSVELVDLINKFRKEERNEVLKRHDDFIRSIRKEIKMLESAGIEANRNFTEGKYLDKNNQARSCFQMNKPGVMQMLNKESALVRYKTQQYIEALESKLKQDPYENLSTEMKALLMHDKKIQKVQKEVSEVKEDLQEFKDDIPLFTAECKEIVSAVRRIGTSALGGKGTKAYNNKSLRAKVYADIHRQLKREFDVNSYTAIKRKHLTNALDIVEKYTLTIALNEQIDMLNNQVAFA